MLRLGCNNGLNEHTACGIGTPALHVILEHSMPERSNFNLSIAMAGTESMKLERPGTVISRLAGAASQVTAQGTM